MLFVHLYQQVHEKFFSKRVSSAFEAVLLFQYILLFGNFRYHSLYGMKRIQLFVRQEQQLSNMKIVGFFPCLSSLSFKSLRTFSTDENFVPLQSFQLNTIPSPLRTMNSVSYNFTRLLLNQNPMFAEILNVWSKLSHFSAVICTFSWYTNVPFSSSSQQDKRLSPFLQDFEISAQTLDTKCTVLNLQYMLRDELLFVSHSHHTSSVTKEVEFR